MVQATFDLPEETLASLEAAAARDGASPSTIVQQALELVLPTQRLSPEEWLAELHKLQAEVAAHMPPGVTPEQIEAEIDAATDEAWAERRAARRS